MDKEIIYYYRRGVASYLIAKKMGISNTKVRGILRRNGIKLRGHDTTNKISASKRTDEENQAITAAASEKNRGATHTLRHRSRLAYSRQQNPTIDPKYEKPLVELCEKKGLQMIPQKAFLKYNVDLYLVEKNVVIEVFGGGFHNKQDAVDMFNNKLAYLSKQNIPVVIVWADEENFSPTKVLKVCMSAKQPVTIITGDGKDSKRGLNDLVI